MVDGLRALAPSPRERVPQAFGLSLNANEMTGDSNHGNPGRMDTRFGREGGPAGGLQPIFPVNIAIADKNPMVLRALEALLNLDRRFNLVLTASDGTHFLSALAHLPVS